MILVWCEIDTQEGLDFAFPFLRNTWGHSLELGFNLDLILFYYKLILVYKMIRDYWMQISHAQLLPYFCHPGEENVNRQWLALDQNFSACACKMLFFLQFHFLQGYCVNSWSSLRNYSCSSRILLPTPCPFSDLHLFWRGWSWVLSFKRGEPSSHVW